MVGIKEGITTKNKLKVQISRDECQPVTYMTIVKHAERMTLLIGILLLSINYRDDVTPTEYTKFHNIKCRK